jgi:hypothetical protein
LGNAVLYDSDEPSPAKEVRNITDYYHRKKKIIDLTLRTNKRGNVVRN